MSSHKSATTTATKKSNLPPINLIFKYLQEQSLVTIWLYEQTQSRIQGKIRGFDEFMNIVIEDAVELHTQSGKKDELGMILLKGDNITLISSLDI
ncbi:uncharacterized protein J8A68_003986 [[Candida] subhashii]|uniref:Small nuclear ribonucleoprotein E n=1 Tax=[Candida] subhashii TaxID=561895 RepID=A0A8J5QTP5_9ASCO|nr:uncharacterized protein J8A68_003986 [[Candida] subhashii]KAG7662455.1 hypothetical protein J8A68_003986 [[Candida] subhashii]